MQSLQGKVALITGASKGIGLAIAASIIQEGGRAAITGRTSETIEQALEFLCAIKGKEYALGFVADVRSLKEQEEVVNSVVNSWGHIDVLVANAGVGHFEDIEDLTVDQWQETIDINLTGVFYTLKAGLSALIKSQGYFITIASLAGTNFFAKGSAYNASKFGLVGFSQAVMLDLRKHGIKTTTIMPGSVSTFFNNHTPSEADSWKIQPEDIGQMVVDLLQMHPRTLPSKIEVRPTSPG
jgi:3-oxoacyl-[acyl-carrier protein] reductase